MHWDLPRVGAFVGAAVGAAVGAVGDCVGLTVGEMLDGKARLCVLDQEALLAQVTVECDEFASVALGESHVVGLTVGLSKSK